MINVMFLLVTVMFVVGVLIGSSLHTHAIARRHRQVTQLVRELHELEEALVNHEEALARSSHLRAIYHGYPTGAARVGAGR